MKKENKAKKTEFEFPWNWRAQMSSIILLLERGNQEGKVYARESLLSLGDKLDAYNYNKELKEQSNEKQRP